MGGMGSGRRSVVMEERNRATELFVEMLGLASKVQAHEDYLPVEARGLISARLAGDQAEAQVLIQQIKNQWNLQ